MPLKLTTTISKIRSVPNYTNSVIISDFNEYMKSIDCSEHHQNNNLKAAIAFARFLGPSTTFCEVNKKEQIIAFLDTKIKSLEQDPDKKWITTWNHYLRSSEFEKKDGRVNRKIGDIVGVSRTTIWQWKQVKDYFSEQELKAISEGKIEPHDLFKKLKAAEKGEKLVQQCIRINSKFQIPDGATIYCGDFRTL